MREDTNCSKSFVLEIRTIIEKKQVKYTSKNRVIKQVNVYLKRQRLLSPVRYTLFDDVTETREENCVLFADAATRTTGNGNRKHDNNPVGVLCHHQLTRIITR